MNKAELRKRALSRRRNIEEKSEKDALIFERFTSSDLYKNAGTLFIYCSTKAEIDTDRITGKAFSDGKRVCVPVCGEGRKMSFFEIKPDEPLNPGPIGIRIPDITGKTPAAADEKTLVVTPGLVFDLSGNRIGYGGGFYDVFLSGGKYRTVGLCYDELLCERIETEPNDLPVQYLITDKRLLSFSE